VFLKLHPRLAPIKAAVFPLVKKDGMPEVAREIYKSLKPHMTVFYDEKSAVVGATAVRTRWARRSALRSIAKRFRTHGHHPRPRHAAAVAVHKTSVSASYRRG